MLTDAHNVPQSFYIIKATVAMVTIRLISVQAGCLPNYDYLIADYLLLPELNNEEETVFVCIL